MNKKSLMELTKLFLKTYGYNSKPTGNDGSLIFSRPTGMGISDDLLVYFHQKGEEGYLDARLKFLNKKYDKIAGGEKGRRFFLSTSPLGIIPEVVKKNKLKYQVPVWFFDREFSIHKKTTPLKRLEDCTTKYEKERIKQPYKVNASVNKNNLLGDFLEDLENPQTPCLRIVIAPAGYGKTVLTEALYAKLKDKFLQNKQAQQIGKRPLIMLPGHIEQATDLNTLINNFIGTEYDYGVSNRDTFKFMVKNNFVVWLLDGLEELILKIPDEFIYTLLEDYIVAGEAKKPQIVVAIRKPVFANLPEFKEYIEDYGKWIKVYELSDWGEDQKTAYFTKNITTENAATKRFLIDLKKSQTLSNLCAVPYYCNLICELHNSNEMKTYNDDCDLVEHAFDKLCEREFTKGLDRELLNVKNQNDLFSDKDLIEIVLKEDKISKETLKELGDLYLNGTTNKGEQLKCLERHAILTQVGNNLDFIHDIIKQYLIARCLLEDLGNTRLDLLNYKEIERDSFLMRYIAKNAMGLNWNRIKDQIASHACSQEKEIGFCNIMNILLQTNVEKKESIIKDVLQNTKLQGMVFKNLNMSGFKFQNSKINRVTFENCDIAGSNFNGCNITHTHFDKTCDLSSTTFKGTIIESIYDGPKIHYDQKAIAEYLFKRTKIPSDMSEPCQAVINTRKILDKLIRKGKGSKIFKRRLIHTKCGGGITANQCLVALANHNILSEEGDYFKVRITLYDQIKAFTLNPNDKTTPKILYDVFNEICTNKRLGCKHISAEQILLTK